MCVDKMSHLSATPCQDVPSFGRFILFVRNSCVLSRCPIFRQHPLKMSHLSAGSYCLYVIHVCCQDVPPSLILNLSFFPLTMFVYTCRQTGHSRPPPPRTQSHLGRMLSSSLEEDCLKPSIRELKTYIEIVHIFPITAFGSFIPSHHSTSFHILFFRMFE